MSIDERKPYPIDEHICMLDFIHMYNSDSISTHIHMHTERLRKLCNTHKYTLKLTHYSSDDFVWCVAGMEYILTVAHLHSTAFNYQ